MYKFHKPPAFYKEQSALHSIVCGILDPEWFSPIQLLPLNWPRVGLGLVSGYGCGTIIPDPSRLFMGNPFPSPDPNPRGRFATLKIKVGL